MRLATYERGGEWVAAVVVADGLLVDAAAAARHAGLDGGGAWGSVRGVLGQPADRLGALADGAEAVAAQADPEVVLDPASTRLGPPVPDPQKILCVGLNYRAHAAEASLDEPPVPLVFAKFPNVLIGSGAAIELPAGNGEHVDYEGEIAVVIGRVTRNVAPESVAAHVAGYTIANDFGLHDFRDTDAGSMLRVKGSDTLCPLGPGLVDDWQAGGKRIRTLVNGQVRQDGSTDEMVWGPHYLVADVARTITLLPGDVILTGTPANSRPVQPGDVVTVEVEGLGALSNRIVAGPVAVRDDVGAQPSESEEVVSTALGGEWEHRGVRPPRRG